MVFPEEIKYPNDMVLLDRSKKYDLNSQRPVETQKNISFFYKNSKNDRN